MAGSCSATTAAPRGIDQQPLKEPCSNPWCAQLTQICLQLPVHCDLVTGLPGLSCSAAHMPLAGAEPAHPWPANRLVSRSPAAVRVWPAHAASAATVQNVPGRLQGPCAPAATDGDEAIVSAAAGPDGHPRGPGHGGTLSRQPAVPVYNQRPRRRPAHGAAAQLRAASEPADGAAAVCEKSEWRGALPCQLRSVRLPGSATAAADGAASGGLLPVAQAAQLNAVCGLGNLSRLETLARILHSGVPWPAQVSYPQISQDLWNSC